MGNCQAVDAAALVIQHPCGKLERMYCPLTASDVMKTNPGHYVSLIIPLPPLSAAADGGSGGHEKKSDDVMNKSPVRFTRVKLLRPTDTLFLGHAYRLVTTQEVMKVIRAKKHAKMMKKKNLLSESEPESGNNIDQADRNRERSGSTNIAAGRGKSWRPSLQSISEAGS
ncbi:hypothetical protein ACP275_12G116300 [Erythranthe tilingii]